MSILATRGVEAAESMEDGSKDSVLMGAAG